MKNYKVSRNDIGKTISVVQKDKTVKDFHVFGVNTEKNVFLVIDVFGNKGFYVNPNNVKSIK